MSYGKKKRPLPASSTPAPPTIPGTLLDALDLLAELLDDAAQEAVAAGATAEALAELHDPAADPGPDVLLQVQAALRTVQPLVGQLERLALRLQRHRDSRLAAASDLARQQAREAKQQARLSKNGKAGHRN